ncbi:hypothetical protein SDC9_144936 [bioreactor metagenome]|uniref:Uncharacterized protein n=1 Tax=bioreactor metagenome TaxID=1076179 RepID=A0A645E8M1_9ZZZZ
MRGFGPISIEVKGMFNRINMKKIFLGENEFNYNRPDRYAFLNWPFDNGLGHNDKRDSKQLIFDNLEMGKAHFANAILTLYSLVYSSNYCDIADSLIFPVFFNVWHSIELLLKSGINALTVLVKNQDAATLNHNIFDLKVAFETALKNAHMDLTLTNELDYLNNLVGEFKKVNAHFDFARYSFDSKGDFQFYNAPYYDSKQWQSSSTLNDKSVVPNTCVDITALFEVLGNIASSFLTLINYLALCVSEEERPTDEGFEGFKTYHLDDDNMPNEDDPIIKILNVIFFEIL